MTQSIQSHQLTLFVPFTKYSAVVDKTHLCAMRCVLSICMISGLALALSSLSQYRLPTWGYVIDGVFTVSSGLALLGTCFARKESPEHEPSMAPRLSLHGTSPTANVSDVHMKLVKKLCGEEEKLGLEHVQDLVTDLKSQNDLAVLNTIPIVRRPASGVYFYAHETTCTPLQYWASQGNLEITKLLVDHGALDYCGGRNDTSALYEAAFYGHMHIVQYLMEQGAHANLAFRKNPLYYFIPKFAFEMVMCMSSSECELPLNCFRYILNAHSKLYPDNLKFQFKIPVDESEATILGWLKKMQSTSVEHQLPMIYELQKVLIFFGAEEDNAITAAELLQEGMNIKVGLTLYEIACLK